MRRVSEAQEQCALFAWAATMMRVHPSLAFLYAIPNGGKRNAREAAHLKRQGVKAGVPDVCLPVPRAQYGALYMELKAKDGLVSDKQADWVVGLQKLGNAVYVCYGWDEARQEILNYLSLGVT